MVCHYRWFVRCRVVQIITYSGFGIDSHHIGKLVFRAYSTVDRPLQLIDFHLFVAGRYDITFNYRIRRGIALDHFSPMLAGAL